MSDVVYEKPVLRGSNSFWEGWGL